MRRAVPRCKFRDLAAIVSAAEADDAANPRRMTLGSLAIMPVQRITRYEILLAALRVAVARAKTKTPAGFEDDVKALERAEALARLAAAEVNVSVATTTASHNLRLSVLAGAGLVDKDRSRFSLAKGKSDPYCVILVDGKELGRTRTIDQTLDPDWTDADETFDLLVASTSQICVRIYDEDRFSRDDPMGEVELDVGELIGNWRAFFELRDAEKGTDTDLSLQLEAREHGG